MKGEWKAVKAMSGNWLIIPKDSGGCVARSVSSETNARLIVEAVNACKSLDNEQPLMVSCFMRDNIDTLRRLYENYKHGLPADDKGEGVG